MKITVIGARGRMGSWFTRYFSTHGYEIYAYDIIDGDTTKEGNVKFIDSSSLNQVVNVSDVVLLSVPIDSMLDSLRVARYMHANAILVEIASLKHGIVKRLKQYALKYGIKGLSIHPLFGPGAEIYARNRYALIPVLDKDEELSIAGSLLGNSSIMVIDSAEMHDRAMAYILGMVYAMNVTWSMLISSKERVTCRELGGTTYRLQSILAEGILNDDPSLFSSLLLNRYLKGYLKRFIKLNENILKMIENKDKKGLERVYANLKRSIKGNNSNNNSIDDSYRLMYRILEGISSNN